VKAAILLAYRELSSAEQSFLGGLGDHPGAEIDAGTASANTGVPRQVAVTLLASLHARGLLMESAPGSHGDADDVPLVGVVAGV
jgi:hypothetical protein